MAKTTIPRPSAPVRRKTTQLPDSAQAVCTLLATTLAGLNAGVIDATQARAVSSCAGMLLKAIQVADLELRIQRLETLAEERP